MEKMGNGVSGANYEELLPRYKSSNLWSDHKELYEKFFCRIHQLLFSRPCFFAMDD